MVLGVSGFRSGLGAAAVSLAALSLLSSCDQRPVPKPTQEPPQSSAPAELLGAPAPPPSDQTTAAAPAETSAPPATAEAEAPPPQPDPLRPPDVTMAPIPDPAPRAEAAPASPPMPTQAAAPAAAHLGARTAEPVHAAARPTAATGAAAATPSAAETVMAGAPSDGPAIAGSEDRGPRADAFQAAALKALHRGAQLQMPTKAEPGQPGQATLTLPAEFGAALRKALTASGLTDAGAPLNITATLSAPGYRVEPPGAQSYSLQAGQPLEFHWTVRPDAGAKPPSAKSVPRAEVCVEAPAGSEPICIGQVSASRPWLKVNSQWLGIVLLVVIVGLVAAWLARSRRAVPGRSAAARRAARRAAGLADADGAAAL